MKTVIKIVIFLLFASFLNDNILSIYIYKIRSWICLVKLFFKKKNWFLNFESFIIQERLAFQDRLLHIHGRGGRGVPYIHERHVIKMTFAKNEFWLAYEWKVQSLKNYQKWDEKCSKTWFNKSSTPCFPFVSNDLPSIEKINEALLSISFCHRYVGPSGGRLVTGKMHTFPPPPSIHISQNHHGPMDRWTDQRTDELSLL